MHRTLASAALFAACLAPLHAQTATLTSNDVLRIHFMLPSAPSPSPDVLEYGIGIVTVNSAYTSRTSRLWNCDTLLGTATSPSFGNYTGTLSLGVCNSWYQAGSPWNFDNPGVVPSFAPVQNGSIQGIIDFEIQTGSMTLNLANVSFTLVQAQTGNSGLVCSPGPILLEAVVVPKLTGPQPGTVGGLNTWSTTGSPPSSLMVYAFSTGCAPILFPSSPAVYFDLALPVVLDVTISDALGASSLGFVVPASASGFHLVTQVGELALPALRVTNFSSYTFP